MTSLFRRLWRLEGTVDRMTYATAGVVAFALKFSVDWTISRFVFHRVWTPLSYWRLTPLVGPSVITPAMFLTLFLVALPFLWFGMAMTLLRLRDAGRSAGWAALFFVPFINLPFFLVLAALPPRGAPARDRSGDVEAAFFAVLLTVSIGAVVVGLATRVLETYGVGVFVAVPFSVGYLSAFVVSRRASASRRSPYIVALVALALLGGIVLAVAWEGALCLLMAMPLAIVVALLGAYCGAHSGRHFPAPRSATLAVLLVPLTLFVETAAHRQPPLYAVTTGIVVDAPAERVWRNVLAFGDITEPPEWYFRAGIAYPLRARIDGNTRYCEFDTGTFIEPIRVRSAPTRLAFDVAANPEPMRELSPYGRIDAPHLHGFLVSQRGEFVLKAIDARHTLLTGTTWYRHRLWPATYWRWWSDATIHRIHLRVLRHIKTLAENAA